MLNPMLSVSVDDVAIFRNFRGRQSPCPLLAAKTAIAAGADSITMHLRDDRYALRRSDIEKIIESVSVPVTLKLAAIEEMVAVVERLQPAACCFVPDMQKRQSVKTALDLRIPNEILAASIKRLISAGINVSILIEPDLEQVTAAKALGLPCVHLCTSSYAIAQDKERVRKIVKLRIAARAAIEMGLVCKAGSELSYQTITEVAAIPEISEISIGHAVIGQSLFEGLSTVVDRFKTLILLSRSSI
jgi:pyridoxine 5-phosphate synthase